MPKGVKQTQTPVKTKAKPAKKPVRKPTVAKKPTGRPRKEIDMNLVDNLCEIQCTGEEIASVIEIDYDTLNARIKETSGKSFSEYIKTKMGKGKVSLRRWQWRSAAEGNVTMLIWLGKQYLGQKDKNDDVEEAKREDGFEKALSGMAGEVWQSDKMNMENAGKPGVIPEICNDMNLTEDE